MLRKMGGNPLEDHWAAVFRTHEIHHRQFLPVAPTPVSAASPFGGDADDEDSESTFCHF
jgi:hypothetical protein